MHYANGREAKNGDKIVLFGYSGPMIGILCEAKNGDKIVLFGYSGPMIGILYDAKAGNDFCNGKIAVTSTNDPCPNLKECLHIEDVMALLPQQQGALSDTHPDIFKIIATVPDAAKK